HPRRCDVRGRSEQGARDPVGARAGDDGADDDRDRPSSGDDLARGAGAPGRRGPDRRRRNPRGAARHERTVPRGARVGGGPRGAGPAPGDPRRGVMRPSDRGADDPGGFEREEGGRPKVYRRTAAFLKPYRGRIAIAAGLLLTSTGAIVAGPLLLR